MTVISPFASLFFSNSINIHKNTIQKNVELPDDAQVIVFLVRHKKEGHKLFIQNYLHHHLHENSIVLTEDPPDSADYKEFSQRFTVNCWEDPTLLQTIREKELLFSSIKDALNHLDDDEYDLSKKTKSVNTVLRNAILLKLISADDGPEARLLSYLKTKEPYADLENDKTLLLNLHEQVHTSAISRTLKNTFSERQSRLIEQIRTNQIAEKIFVICGTAHGDPEASFNPQETERFLDFLQSTDYCLFNLEKFEEVQLNAFSEEAAAV